MRMSRVLLAGAAVAAAGIATSAFTASNSVNNSVAGYDEATVTGATVTDIDYNVNATDSSVLDSIDFLATENVSGMQAILQLQLADGTAVGSPITCTVGAFTTATPINCPTPGREITAFQGIGLTVAQ
ncbi:hypothetical protein [Blastococcus goldschmidtiae]|uniref:Uncharacterized protein n=1 Tax=Blastococcus goldschmidtiae TaxID=3075546 RepID=A0ABU2K1W5_9ACTN|nr:hypothetical protein [Blastococcus sp. DSM 46792]MDT0274278.1 hypothetical protein [Blastococcus sp. DSM 46792]